MGKKSRGKQTARAQRRDRTSVLEALVEARDFLRVSGLSYDAGFEGEAKRLAVTLRVLLHDTSSSHSLLEQLRVKGSIDFTDTAAPINPRNLAATPGLVLMQMEMQPGVPVGSYIAPLGMERPFRNRPAPFAGWWSNPVMKEPSGKTWSRRDFVLVLANQEGGAHLDPALNLDYEALAKRNGLGWQTVGAEGVADFRGDAVAASVRQVAWEVEDTLARNEHQFVVRDDA